MLKYQYSCALLCYLLFLFFSFLLSVSLVFRLSSLSSLYALLFSPSQSPELLSLNDDSMEEGEAKEQLLIHKRFRRHTQLRIVQLEIRLSQIGTKTWGLHKLRVELKHMF